MRCVPEHPETTVLPEEEPSHPPQTVQALPEAVACIPLSLAPDRDLPTREWHLPLEPLSDYYV